jgi:antitoxin (DNA-binding transcriptional repressor) of toxin-antitoxin stability system
MNTVTLEEAKEKLEELIEEAAARGVPFLIEAPGMAAFEVSAVQRPRPTGERRLGFLKGHFAVPEDFDTMYAKEIQDMFEGNE